MAEHLKLESSVQQNYVTVYLENEDADFLSKLETVICAFQKRTSKTQLSKREQSVKKTKYEMRILFASESIQETLRGFTVSHRFQKAAQFLETNLPRINKKSHALVAKSCLLVLENLQLHNTSDILENFTRYAASLCVRRTEFLLEYLIFRLKDKNFVLPRELIQTRHTKLGRILGKNRIIDPLFKAYIALFDYIVWAVAVNTVSDSHSQYGQEIHDISAKIVATWSEVITEPGIWDIFLEKLIEVLEKRGDYEQCDVILQRYLESHKDHLNAYVYMEHYKKDNLQERKGNLKQISKMSPSDLLVLDYVDILAAEAKCNEALKRMFNFMDYAINKENLRGWTTLVELSNAVNQRSVKVEKITLKEMWKNRLDYWPQYHFDVDYLHIDNKLQSKVYVQKCLFLTVGPKYQDHAFIQVASLCLKDQYPKRYSRLQQKLASLRS